MGKVVRQDHHEWINQDTVTLSRELAERSKGVFGVCKKLCSLFQKLKNIKAVS